MVLFICGVSGKLNYGLNGTFTLYFHNGCMLTLESHPLEQMNCNLTHFASCTVPGKPGGKMP